MAKIQTLLVLLMTAVTGAWADGERTSHWPDFSPENYEKYNTLVAGIMIDGVIITADIPGYELTLAEGSEAHGTVAFTIGGQAATEAKKDDVVTLTVTPEEGWIVTQITAETYNNWESAGARRTAPVSVPILGDVELTPVEGTANAWTFQMPAANVEVAVSYAQPYTVRVAAGRFTTFFAGENIQLDQQTPEGVTLHTITGISDTEATVSASLEGIIAAETPLLVYNGTAEEQTVTIIPTMEQADGSVTWAEVFRGTATDSTFTEAAMQAADYYLLSGGKAFAKVYGAGTLTKNQCWLQFDKQQVSGARSISLVFEGETTKIENGKLKMENSAGAVYDLQGRRVESSIFRSASPLGSSKNSQSSNLKKGVYVKDGRKVVVK